MRCGACARRACGCATPSRRKRRKVAEESSTESFPDSLHAFDGDFHERDDALAQRLALETIAGFHTAGRSFQCAVLVNAGIPFNALARCVADFVLISLSAHLARVNVFDGFRWRHKLAQ